MTTQKEFGDFQTPIKFSMEIVDLLSNQFGTPGHIIEPTCGIGNFIEAAYNKWGVSSSYLGYEINNEYCKIAKNRFSAFSSKINITNCDFFSVNWQKIFATLNSKNNYTLVLGNPPWVTNSMLGKFESTNMPDKSNFQRFRGLDAMTGKSNFDIAEWMIIKMFEALPLNSVVAMLCKTATARKVLRHLWKNNCHISNVKLYHIDAQKKFKVSVDACLFIVVKNNKNEPYASIFEDFNKKKSINRFGYLKGKLIADIDNYLRYKDIDGSSNYQWRSGIKHDASKVMEFEKVENKYKNGYGVICQLEDEFVYPLLKSSDLGNGRINPRKFILITQNKVGADTEYIKKEAPLVWKYLNTYVENLDKRKSSIYKKQPRFSIFGVGKYSFSPWKVAISGLYKKLKFVAIPPSGVRAVMLDDTCYFFPCRSSEEALFWEKLLNTDTCLNFLYSLIFLDAKRPITIDILKRIDFIRLAIKYGVFEEAKKYSQTAKYEENTVIQPMFVFEENMKYQINN